MVRRFISSLTDTDRQALAEVHQYGQKRALLRRAHAILLSDQDYTINQISDILEVVRNTLTIWFQKWEASGLEELVDKPRSGRDPILHESDRARLQALVEEHPRQLRTLQARLQEETGKTFSTTTLRRALKKNDNSFKRIRYSLKSRRDEADFRNTQGLLKALQEREDQGEHELYYSDESGFSQSSSVPYAWSPMGKPWEVTAYSHSRRLNVLGFVSRKGMLVYHTIIETVTTDTVIEAFDKFVAQKDLDAFAVAVLDNASMHRSKAFKRKILE